MIFTKLANYSNQLQRVFEIQEIIQDIHPFLEKLFPIAIVENDHFLIYDIESENQRYEFVQEAAVPMPIPHGVRAAFNLESYDNRMACVVTCEVFDELGGYVTIFHEFIHCQQAESCESNLKQKLEVARLAQEVHDYMWEINYPFPYAAPDFVQLYQSFLNIHTLSEIESVRQELVVILKQHDYEYMVWQEWKEGLARFIENQIRRRLGLAEYHGGTKQPYNRVVFYAGGAHYIEILSKQESDLSEQIEKLFDRMFTGS
jgi:anion-transporting  ArsA/GET3 family ATPase